MCASRVRNAGLTSARGVVERQGSGSVLGLRGVSSDSDKRVSFSFCVCMLWEIRYNSRGCSRSNAECCAGYRGGTK